MTGGLTLGDIEAAAARIHPHVRRTPVFTSRTLDERVGARIFFKCENFQRAGAFKIRGASNVLFGASDAELRHGVATHSSGNHGQAVALAARLRGTTARIVMPRGSTAVKRAAVAGYGAEIVNCEPTQAGREKTLDALVAETGAKIVHPYNDLGIMAGQGTAALELLDEVSDLDMLLAPVGGGGLISGTAIVAHGRDPRLRVVGAEPAGADDAWRSFQAGALTPIAQPDTIADGLRAMLGELPFKVVQEHLETIVCVDDPAIIRAMRLLWERMKLVIEPSAAVPVAALLEGYVSPLGRRIGVILSGGNVDLDQLPWS